MVIAPGPSENPPEAKYPIPFIEASAEVERFPQPEMVRVVNLGTPFSKTVSIVVAPVYVKNIKAMLEGTEGVVEIHSTEQLTEANDGKAVISTSQKFDNGKLLNFYGIIEITSDTGEIIPQKLLATIQPIRDVLIVPGPGEGEEVFRAGEPVFEVVSKEPQPVNLSAMAVRAPVDLENLFRNPAMVSLIGITRDGKKKFLGSYIPDFMTPSLNALRMMFEKYNELGGRFKTILIIYQLSMPMQADGAVPFTPFQLTISLNGIEVPTGTHEEIEVEITEKEVAIPINYPVVQPGGEMQ